MPTTPQPMRRAVAFTKSHQGLASRSTEIFGRLVELYIEQYPTKTVPRHAGCEARPCGRHDERACSAQAARLAQGRYPAKATPAASCPTPAACPRASTCRRWTRWCSSIPAQSDRGHRAVGRPRHAQGRGKKYGYIILPVCIPSENVAEEAYRQLHRKGRSGKSCRRLGGHRRALRRRINEIDLVDEAEFRRRSSVIGVGGERMTASDGEARRAGDSCRWTFPALPIDAGSEAVYAAIVPRSWATARIGSDWAKTSARSPSARLPHQGAGIDGKPGGARSFARFLRACRTTSTRRSPSATRSRCWPSTS